MPLQVYRTYGAMLLLCSTCLLFSLPGAAEAAAALKLNDQGSQVALLQKELQSLDYVISDIDGIFGPDTKQAVLLFQRDKRIKITGIVDARTWKELNRAKPAPKKPPAAALKPMPSPSPTPSPAIKITETPPFVPQASVSKIMKTAKSYIGVPYKFGGATPKGFDCSGYVQYTFSQNKFSLPRSADEQFKLGKKVAPTALREGDLVFFSTYEPGPSHCGIYIGGGQFIHASSSKGIRIDKLDDSYWKPRYLAAKRITK